MNRTAKINRIAEAVADDQITSRGEFKEFAYREMFDESLPHYSLNAQKEPYHGMDMYVADTNGNDDLYAMWIFVDDEKVRFCDVTYNEDYYEKGDEWSLEMDDSHLYPCEVFPFSGKDFKEWFDKRVAEGIEEGRKALDARPDRQKQADAEDGDSKDELEELTVGGGYVEIGDNGMKVRKAYIPNWALASLINSDSSGISEEEDQMITNWWNKNHVEYVEATEEKEEFIPHPEFGGGCECTVCLVAFK